MGLIPPAPGGGVPGIQASLRVSRPDDPYEREAEEAARRVVADRPGLPPTLSAPSPTGPPAARTPMAGTEGPSFPATRLDAGRGRGTPLPSATRAFFEPRFGADFSAVRVHTGGEAAALADAIHARAFTCGRDIYFASGAWAPESLPGRRLLAHELAHTIQQGGIPSGVVQRDPDDGEVTPQVVGQDPGLLLCFVLCELGVPPAIWRDITEAFLRAVWDEYRAQYGRLQADARFEAFRSAFMTYSPIRVIQLVLTFAVQGKIGLIPVRTAAARSAQEALKRQLIRRGATEAGIIAAEQIARKVVIAIEVAIAAGCAAYCTAHSYAVLMRDLADEVAAGIVAFGRIMETLGSIGSGLAGAIADELIVRPLLYAETILEVNNWRLGNVPPAARADLLALGLYFSHEIRGDDVDALIHAHAQPISSYDTAPEIVREAVAEINRDREVTEEEPLDAEALVAGLPSAFFQTLHEEGYLDFVRDPEEIVDELLGVERVRVE